jgi:hypothetical protein
MKHDQENKTLKTKDKIKNVIKIAFLIPAFIAAVSFSLVSVKLVYDAYFAQIPEALPEPCYSVSVLVSPEENPVDDVKPEN